jgi:2-hydroxy-6-oxonona-2,4-dienedioate hydrolase
MNVSSADGDHQASWTWHSDVRAARQRTSAGSTLVSTRSGPIEYAQVGQGKPLLVVHGAGGGYDQGLLFSRPLAERGFCVTAVSRFGYLRTPLPADASPEAQADAHASLLDALQIPRTVIIGASAGALSAMQFAIRHPQRCSGLILLVPLAWKPSDIPDSARPLSAGAQRLLLWMVGSDPVFWLALHLAHDTVVKKVLGTPPAVVEAASVSEQWRVEEVLNSVLPLGSRAAGLQNDGRIAQSLTRYDLEAIQAPTLIVSVRDDLYGTYAGAEYTARHIRGARFVGYEQGGHMWVGHHDELLEEVAAFAARSDTERE